ncbi:MAG: cytochrome C assembly protein [Anaerolineaceae bacterium]|nr:MAG: cytochrome C assembly protein [Anaerolineaceae bacterium]
MAVSATASTTPASGERPPRSLIVLTVITALSVGVSLYLTLIYANTDLEQGDVQRLFYIHMPSFFGAFFAFGATVLGGIQYLRTRQTRWDTLALAGVEVGLALSIINLVTGSIWARPIWNTWWTWDARLTSAAIMVLTYAAYLMFRSGIENPDTRRRFASVYGIVAITTVILTLVIIRIVPDTIHPAVIGPSPQNAEGTFEATTNVAIALIPNMIIWTTIIPIALMWWRIRLENRLEAINRRKIALLSEDNT